jgi:type VI secretion system protein ImpH
MAGPDRDLEGPWKVWQERLVAEPARHEFIDVLDLLARFADPVVLRHATSLGFARGEVEGIELHEGEGKPSATVTAAFFGLAGETSPLPLSVAEEADRDDDHAAIVRGLFDIFHQRLLALMHMGITALDYPRSFREDGKDPMTRGILSLLGLTQRTGSLPPAVLLRLAPILASGVRSPEMLEAGLRIALDGWLDRAQVRCSPFTGDWMEIDRPEWSRLGGTNAALAASSVLGTTVMHRAGGARINVGPLSGDAYRQFMPGGQAHARVQEFTGAFLSAPVKLEMVLEVEDMTYPPGRLGERRMGDDLWLARSGRTGLATKIKVALDEETPR